MDPLTVAGWGLVYAGIGSLVARVVYRLSCRPGCGDSGDAFLAFLAFLAMLLWPTIITTGVIWAILTLLAPLGRALAASWEWWLRD